MATIDSDPNGADAARDGLLICHRVSFFFLFLLCFNLGLLLVDLGAFAPALLAHSGGRFRASSLSLPHASSHLRYSPKKVKS